MRTDASCRCKRQSTQCPGKKRRRESSALLFAPLIAMDALLLFGSWTDFDNRAVRRRKERLKNSSEELFHLLELVPCKVRNNSATFSSSAYVFSASIISHGSLSIFLC